MIGHMVACPQCGIPFAALRDETTANYSSSSAVDRFDDTPPVGQPSVRLSEGSGCSEHLGLEITGRVIRFGMIGALIGCLGLAFFGLLLSQYWPVFGGILERGPAKPWSPARVSLIPIHLLVFGVLGMILGGVLGAVACYTARARGPSAVPLPKPDLPEVATPSSPRRYWRRLLLGMVAVLPALAIVGVLIRLLSTGGYIGPAGQTPENRSQARTDEEELVERYIQNNADLGAGKVKFLTWGPHLDKQEMSKMLEEAGAELSDVLCEARAGRHLMATTLRDLDVASAGMKLRGVGELKTFRAIIRVRYERPAELDPDEEDVPPAAQHGPRPQREGSRQPKVKAYDALFWVDGKRVIPLQPLDVGDDWIHELRKELSKRFPALKP
jgi:hypothetical protein